MTKRRTAPGKPQPQVSNPYDFEAPAVDETLYEQDRAMFPTMIYMAKYAGNDDESRPFVIEVDKLSGSPTPYWTEEEIKFGDSPSEPYTSVYSTTVARIVPLGVRKRQVIEADDGTQYYFPLFTSEKDRVDSEGRPLKNHTKSYRFHYQVLAQLEGLPIGELVLITMKGLTRTLSWNHDGNRYNGFPVGAENRLQQYAAEASKIVGKMPIWCAWWTDLRGAYAENKPYFLSVGPSGETWVQPFTADLRTSKEPRPESGVYTEDGWLAVDSQGLPWTRYVGQDLFNQLQDLRRDIVNPWIEEWEKAHVQEAEEGSNHGSDPIGTQEDDLSDIPF